MAVESVPGAGATFMVWLPELKSEQKRCATPGSPERAPISKRAAAWGEVSMRAHGMT
jgi:hypothetical protein